MSYLKNIKVIRIDAKYQNDISFRFRFFCRTTIRKHEKYTAMYLKFERYKYVGKLKCRTNHFVCVDASYMIVI